MIENESLGFISVFVCLDERLLIVSLNDIRECLLWMNVVILWDNIIKYDLWINWNWCVISL